MFTLERIDHVALTVKDVKASAKWYKETLGLEQYYEGEWDGVPLMIGKGGTCIALFKAKGENPLPPPKADTFAMMHLAFKADRINFEEAQRQLNKKAIKFEFADHNISHSIYFNDPDGHKLEITTYEV
jgi:catechol 2,3-dioxygenase-like lactoylglutathione lyase family enzyme